MQYINNSTIYCLNCRAEVENIYCKVFILSLAIELIIKRMLEVKVLTIKILFSIQKDIACALNYLKKTRMATRK